MKLPVLEFRTAFPPATTLVWLWSGLVVLLLLGVRWLWTPSPTSPSFVEWLPRNPWRESDLPLHLVRTQILLAIWLWVSHRGRLRTRSRHATRRLVGLLAAGVMLLVLAYAIQAAMQPPVSGWELTRIHP